MTLVACPVPPLATGKIPVTPVVSGSPVPLVSTTALGVPSAGVVSVGEVPKTKAPDPVSLVTAVAKLALVGVPKNVAIPDPNEVIPVPPFATGSVPVTPVVKDKLVALLKLTDVGVPKIGVVNVGDVPKTNAPVPVSLVTAVAKFALVGVAKNVKTPEPAPVRPVEIGSPVALVSVIKVGTPRLGVVKVGDNEGALRFNKVAFALTTALISFASTSLKFLAGSDKGKVLSLSAKDICEAWPKAVIERNVRNIKRIFFMIKMPILLLDMPQLAELPQKLMPVHKL